VILLDSNVLVALVDERDALHARAKGALRRARSGPLVVTTAVLSETLFFLERAFERRRLRFLLDSLDVGAAPTVDRSVVLDWMERYEEHAPDWADAEIVVLSQARGRRVWTYDREFAAIWRRADGTRVPLVT